MLAYLNKPKVFFRSRIIRESEIVQLKKKYEFDFKNGHGIARP